MRASERERARAREREREGERERGKASRERAVVRSYIMYYAMNVCERVANTEQEHCVCGKH